MGTIFSTLNLKVAPYLFWVTTRSLKELIKIGVAFFNRERERGREGERERDTSYKLKTQFCLLFEPYLSPDIFERGA